MESDGLIHQPFRRLAHVCEKVHVRRATQPQEPAEKRRHSERVMPQQRTVLRRFSFQELQLRRPIRFLFCFLLQGLSLNTTSGLIIIAFCAVDVAAWFQDVSSYPSCTAIWLTWRKTVCKNNWLFDLASKTQELEEAAKAEGIPNFFSCEARILGGIGSFENGFGLSRITSADIEAEIDKEIQEAIAAAEDTDAVLAIAPRKPNWDLKRDVERKMHTLAARTDRAVVQLIRQRIKKDPGTEANPEEKK
eukprot:g13508.t1